VTNLMDNNNATMHSEAKQSKGERMQEGRSNGEID
jgi:hypothetical protein